MVKHALTQMSYLKQEAPFTFTIQKGTVMPPGLCHEGHNNFIEYLRPLLIHIDQHTTMCVAAARPCTPCLHLLPHATQPSTVLHVAAVIVVMMHLPHGVDWQHRLLITSLQILYMGCAHTKLPSPTDSALHRPHPWDGCPCQVLFQPGYGCDASTCGACLSHCRQCGVFLLCAGHPHGMAVPAKFSSSLDMVVTHPHVVHASHIAACVACSSSSQATPMGWLSLPSSLPVRCCWTWW
jgi:hypothetical protein